MRRFAELFRKYRLRAEFETFAAFSDALSAKGYFYEESIFSHWQKGTRMPSNRQLVLKILEIFVERKAVKSFEEANELLESAGMGYLTEAEKEKFFQEEKVVLPSPFPNKNFFELLNRLIFIILGLVGMAVFLIYSFVDVKNMLIFFTFGVNFALSLLLYLQVKRTPAFFAFLVTAFGISAWDLAMIFFRAASAENAVIAAKLLYSFPVVIPTSFVLFGLFFAEKRVHKSLIYFFVISTVVVAILTLLKDAVIFNVIIPIPGEKIIEFGLVYYYVYVFYYPLFFAFGYYIFLKRCLKTAGVIRMQLLFIIVGMILGSIPSLITNILLPFLGNHEYNWMGPLWTIFWVTGVYLSIIKYQLLDLKFGKIFKS